MGPILRGLSSSSGRNPQDSLQHDDLLTKTREFLSDIWPLGDVKVSGKRLQKMYVSLAEADRQKEEEEKAKAKNPDLEDGEIPSDRDEPPRERDRDQPSRRPPPSRDPYRDDRREQRH